MVYARVSSWKFKRGQSEAGLKVLDQEIAPNVRTTKGFKGALFLIPNEDADSLLAITLWGTEEDQKISGKGIFQEATKKLEKYVDGPPDVKGYEVHSGELHV